MIAAEPIAAETISPPIDSCLRGLIGNGDCFCWNAGRLLILLNRKNALPIHHELRRITKAIAKISGATEHRSYLTPAIGYVSLAEGSTAEELFYRAETALACAKSSLEIEPFRYTKAADPLRPPARIASPSALWRKVPSTLGLGVQLLLSVVLGFGAPFILYAICDALGSDISGPVYIGVVIVLLITASTIWIEGFLALRATDPPVHPGAPAPMASVIIPAYLPNEASTIVETVEAFLRLNYANTIQVIIAYNSPFDRLPVEDELEAIAERYAHDNGFHIEPVRIVGSTSKAQNVNAAVGMVRGEFVGIFDADHHPLPDSIERAWRWLSNGWDIVQGRCSIRNGHESWVARMVAVEFEQIYAVSHPGRARLHGFGIFGGSNGFWRTAVLHETRMRHAMLTEDIDSSIRAVEAGYRIAGDRDLISEELAPTSLKQLLNQRLRWAQGWFQVSLRRIGPALFSRHVTVRQKLGLFHLLVWRELFPWYSIQVLPIMTYWVWIYGWSYIHWAIPIFLFTTIFTVMTGPAMIFFAYRLSRTSMRQRPGWFLEYLLLSTFFYAPFKDTLSRIAHLKEAMRERAWRVTPRRAPATMRAARLAAVTPVAVLLALIGVTLPEHGTAQTLTSSGVFADAQISTLIGGEVLTINAARSAARSGRNAEAATLYATAIRAVPGRRAELLREYADALLYSKQSRAAAPLYRELLASRDLGPGDRRALLEQLATSLTWSGQNQAALAAYDQLCSLVPSSTELPLRRARLLLTLGRGGDAVAALGRIPAERWASGPSGRAGDELLIDAARADAGAARNASAVKLYEQAMRHNPRLRTSLLPEYGDQLAAMGRHDAAVRAYGELIADPGTSAAQRGKAKARLAALSPRTGRSGDTAEVATSATTKAVQRAQQLAALHQDEAALHAYEQAVTINRNDLAARRGVIDQTIVLARLAAQQDRNAVSASLFSKALGLDQEKRPDILREYADQLGFSGHAADAIPIYLDLLNDPKQPALARTQTMIGLANAYEWVNRLDDAAAVYAQLERADPADRQFRLNRLVVDARIAARDNDNRRSAGLFAQAIALKPDIPASIRRQYADQLTFTSRAGDAIDIYRSVIRDAGVSPADRTEAQLGLARAYGYSGRLGDANAVYKQLVAEHPDDPSLRWQQLVGLAREAAKEDRNAVAAGLFAQAIKLQPARSGPIAREYADQLTFTGRSANAVILYRQILKDERLTADDRPIIERSLARALGWSGNYADAKLAYADLIRRFPDDVTLKRDLLIASAREAARTDRNEDAAAYLAKALAIDPAKRYDVLAEYAAQLTYAHRGGDAVPLYRELLARDRLPADVRRDEIGLATAFAWTHKPMEAFAEYKQVLAMNPDDLETQNSMARMLSWAGRQGEAVAAYHAILMRHPNDAVAMRGLAQAEDTQGHHRAAQVILTRRLKNDPNDLEARRLLAQSNIWSGRPDKAMDEVKGALKLRSRPQNSRLMASATIVQATGQPGEQVTASAK